MFVAVGGILLLYVFRVSAQINPCAFTLCPYGSQCVAFNDCSTKPCTNRARCIRPHCLPDGLKCSSTGECCSGCCNNGVCTKYDDSICSPCCNTKCEPGSHCAEQQVYCTKAPCPPRVVCVKDPPAEYNATLKCLKPKKLQLKSGSDDQTSEICANVPKCQCPIEKYEQNPCCGIQCNRGSRCALNQVYCFRAPCPPFPVCVKNPPVKYNATGKCPPNKKLKFISECKDKNKVNCEICITKAPKCSCPKKVENPCCRLNCKFGSRCALEQAFCINPPCAPLPVCAKNPPADYNATMTCSNNETFQLNSDCNDKERNCEICVKSTQQCPVKPPIPMPPLLFNNCCCTKCECGYHCALRPGPCFRGLCSKMPICVKDPPADYNTTLTCSKPYSLELMSGCNVPEERCELCALPAPKCIGKINCPLIRANN